MARSSTSFSKENPRPGKGRRKLSDEEKRRARLERAASFDYKREIAALFPIVTDQLAEQLEKKSFKGGDIVRVYETVRDTLHGKPAQAITGIDGGPLEISFTGILAKVNGGRVERVEAIEEILALPNGNGNGNGHH